jgi:hypothetical protein
MGLRLHWQIGQIGQKLPRRRGQVVQIFSFLRFGVDEATSMQVQLLTANTRENEAKNQIVPGLMNFLGKYIVPRIMEISKSNYSYFFSRVTKPTNLNFYKFNTIYSIQ